MKNKKLVIICIVLCMIIVLLVGYIIGLKSKESSQVDNNTNEDVIVEEENKGYSLDEMLAKIVGYWHGSGDYAFYVTSFNTNKEYEDFYYASEGGSGGVIKGLTYVDDNNYRLDITINPQVICTEEYCAEGANIGDMSDYRDVIINMDISKLDQRIIKLNDIEFSYLGSTWSEMESNIFK